MNFYNTHLMNFIDDHIELIQVAYLFYQNLKFNTQLYNTFNSYSCNLGI